MNKLSQLAVTLIQRALKDMGLLYADAHGVWDQATHYAYQQYHAIHLFHGAPHTIPQPLSADDIPQGLKDHAESLAEPQEVEQAIAEAQVKEEPTPIPETPVAPVAPVPAISIGVDGQPVDPAHPAIEVEETETTTIISADGENATKVGSASDEGSPVHGDDTAPPKEEDTTKQ